MEEPLALTPLGEVEMTDVYDKDINHTTEVRTIRCGAEQDRYAAEFISQKKKVPTFCNNAITTSKYSINPFSTSFILYRNLYEQFRRLANVYFLFIAILQLIPGVSPTGQFTTILPLAFVMFLSMCKDAFEDFKRHQQDRMLNNLPAKVFRNGEWVTQRWADIAVGDILEVPNREPFAADLIVLSTSEPDGLCYIETSSLDGETNLKMRKAVSLTYKNFDITHTGALSAIVNTELPNNRLETFSGNITINGTLAAISNENVVLRGACLRNTQILYGLVVFTGQETKLMKNSSQKRLKMSEMDHITNRQVLLIFFLQIIICCLCTVGLGVYTPYLTTHWYLAPQHTDGFALVLLMGFATFLILFNNLIPISLYVSMEMVKLVQAYFINSDISSYHPDTDTPAQARTSSLNEELGQVSYIFSDKTGTLTCNMMDFVKFACVGAKGNLHQFGQGITEIARAAAARDGITLKDPRPPGVDGFYDPTITEGNWKSHSEAAAIEFFLCHLGVCHTVVIEQDEKTKKSAYQAASPDEACLVKAAKMLGIEFVSRTERTVTISVLGEERVYELLYVIQFDSTRKRMSTIVRAPDGRIMLLCKGADSIICERLRNQDSASKIMVELNSALSGYGSEGLRTLVLAYSVLEEGPFKEWAAKYEEALCAIVNREEKVANVGAEIEWNMELIGATAIEDKLQGGVASTIELMIAAGIKVWVLTGDKKETAINIGFACALLNSSMNVMTFEDVTEANIESELKQLVAKARNEDPSEAADLSLVIQGHLLITVLENPKIALIFLELAKMCKAVVCCRVSPLQKAQVVSLVKNNVAGAITLAIGDGANDVSMIQAAHVGIGISGLEGLQAARASDYSIAQFRFLQPLLLVHGRYSYRRIARLIMYSFYKNISLYLTQLWFCIYNAFSGQSLIDSWALALYNVVFTAFPIMVVATLDRDVAKERLLHVDQFPELYQDGIRGRLFSTKRFWIYVMNAIFHSAVAFFIPYYGACLVNDPRSGNYPDISALGVLSYTIILFIVTGKVGLETLSWTWINVGISIASLGVWFAFIFVYSQLFSFAPITDFANWYGVPGRFVPTTTFWLTILIAIVVALGRDFVFKYGRRHFNNRELSHVVQVLEYTHPTGFSRKDVPKDESHLLMRLETLAPKPTAHRFVPEMAQTGFAFAQEDHQGDTMGVIVKTRAVKAASAKFMSYLRMKKKTSESSPVTPTSSSAPPVMVAEEESTFTPNDAATEERDQNAL